MGWRIEEFNMGSYTTWYVSVDSIDGELKKLIDQYIVDICFADSLFSVHEAKTKIKEFLKSDNDDRKRGAVAEFLIHVFMKTQGYKQECLYLNLEERSPKKGFDGIYVDTSESIWYMESKSGSNKSNTHKAKVKEAYKDLKEKFAGTTSNDPWRNALNHAKVVGAEANILDLFRRYTRDYDKHICHNIEEYNVIPCGTLYLDDAEKEYISKDVVADIDEFFNKMKKSGLNVICFTQQAVDEFERYLDE